MASPDLRRDPNRFAQRLFAPLPQHYNRLAEVLSMGQNGRWRRAMIDHIVPDRPRLVLDVACGPAGVSLQIAERTDARVVGVDLTPAMLREGQRAVAERQLGERVQLVNGRGEQLPFAGRHLRRPHLHLPPPLRGRPPGHPGRAGPGGEAGGAVANQEFLLPESRFWRFWWWGYTRLLLPAGGWLTGGREWFEVGRFLGPNIEDHYRRYPLAWTVEAWVNAGLVDVGVRRMSLGGGLVMWGRRRDG